MWPFKKKEEELPLELDKGLGLGAKDLGLPPAEPPTPGLPEEPKQEVYDKLSEKKDVSPLGSFTEPEHTISPNVSPITQSPDIQLISAKLDTIKAMLDALNHRMENLERSSGEKKKLW